MKKHELVVGSEFDFLGKNPANLCWERCNVGWASHAELFMVA